MIDFCVLTVCLGEAGPVLRLVAPEADGSSVLVSWSWPRNRHWSKPVDMLHYVLEWTAVPVTELWWQHLSKDCNNTSVTGTENSLFTHTGTHTH